MYAIGQEVKVLDHASGKPLDGQVGESTQHRTTVYIYEFKNVVFFQENGFTGSEQFELITKGTVPNV